MKQVQAMTVIYEGTPFTKCNHVGMWELFYFKQGRGKVCANCGRTEMIDDVERLSNEESNSDRPQRTED